MHIHQHAVHANLNRHTPGHFGSRVWRFPNFFFCLWIHFFANLISAIAGGCALVGVPSTPRLLWASLCGLAVVIGGLSEGCADDIVFLVNFVGIIDLNGVDSLDILTVLFAINCTRLSLLIVSIPWQ